MASAGTQAGLVHVEMLIEPAGLEDRPSDPRIDSLDRVVIGLEESQGNVDLARHEGGHLAFLVVWEVLVCQGIETRPPAARHRWTRPARVAHELDRVDAGRDVLERARSLDSAQIAGEIGYDLAAASLTGMDFM